MKIIVIWIASCFLIPMFQVHNVPVDFGIFVSDSLLADCKDLIVADETIDGSTQFLKTISLTLVKRGNYSYAIEFINDQSLLVAKINSHSGVKFNKGDQVIFMNDSKTRVAVNFIGKSKSKNENQAHYNFLGIDKKLIDWLSTNIITTIYIKDNIKNEMRKFTINESRQAEFKRLANCFNINLADAY